MHLILLHGYLLDGTGSNIYVANIARSWATQGHAVTVICQHVGADSLPFVDEYVGPGDVVPDAAPAAGLLRVVVADIGGLLPVYVADEYPGFRVKTLPTLTASETEMHIESTARTLRAVAMQGAERVLANHVLLGPVIARRALEGTGVPFDVKVHGSAIEYSLVPHAPLMPLAVEGLAAAEWIYVGTRHVRTRVLDVFAEHADEIGLGAKVRIVPPGMDPALFTIGAEPTEQLRAFLGEVARRLRQNDGGRRPREAVDVTAQTPDELHRCLVDEAMSYDQKATDADLLERWPALGDDEPRILYVGKFLDTKGVGELLVTVPTILERVPGARIFLVGFGSYREHLEGMLQALRSGDATAFAAYARAGGFVDDLDFGRWFRRLSPAEAERITFTGCLDHGALAALLPLMDVSVVPSKWGEPFGMVAVEAMAAGVLPLCNYHAGLRDVVDEVAETDRELAEAMSVPRERFVEALPRRVEAALQLLFPAGPSDRATQREIGARLRSISVATFSWDGIAARLLG